VTAVEVVMPVRNVTAYMEEAVDSVFAQVDTEPRLVVVDAGSDVPVVLPPRYHDDPRVTLLRSEIGLNAGGARNLGVRQSACEYLAFLDADDRWPPTRTRDLAAALRASNAAVALGMVRHFSSTSSGGLHVPANLRPAYAAGGLLLPWSTWHRVGPFESGLRTGEFVEWYTRFQALGLTATIVESVTLERRVHAASTTATQRADRSEYLKVVRAWMNRNG
jgi:glycosyltransferase involved in cell wall biosynthesis